MPLIAVGIRNISVGFYCKKCKRIIPGKNIKNDESTRSDEI
jgi:hypothetical protein